MDVSFDKDLIAESIRVLADDNDLIGFDEVCDHFISVSIKNDVIREKFKKISNILWPEHVSLFRQLIVEDEFYNNNKKMVNETYKGVMRDNPGFVGFVNKIADMSLKHQEKRQKLTKKELKKIAAANVDRLWNERQEIRKKMKEQGVQDAEFCDNDQKDET